jgi:leucine-rich repeat/fibronectin type-III domain-containing protein 4
MDGNYIKELPKNVFSNLGLNHLQKISLRDASIQIMHESAFADLRILKEINLQGNNISVLPPQAFQGNTGLRTLLLGGNSITRLKAHQFPPLRNLRKIDLSGNRLESVHKLAFQNLAQGDVEEINLSENRLTRMSAKTFTALGGKLKHLPLHGNPWLCDCQPKSFRDFVVHRALATGPGVATCAEPVRLADRPWDRVKSQEFACRPEVEVVRPKVFAERGQNATLECRILGNPVPAVKWVLHGRVIQNRSSPLQASPGQLYIINSVATREGGIERNYSLTITGVTSRDLGSYSCVAINAGGVSEMEVKLTFDSGSAAGLPFDEKELTIIIGVASGVLLILLVLLLLLCCCCRYEAARCSAVQCCQVQEGCMKPIISFSHQSKDP